MLRPNYISLAFLIVYLQLTFVASLRCLRCTDAIQARDCDQIVECDRGQMCYYHKGINQNLPSIGVRVDMGCMIHRQCIAIQHANTHNRTGCCDNADYCNSVIFSTTSATSVPSTTTGPTTTMPTTKIVINGPGQAAYQTMAQLQCVTVPPAEKYSWKFNGTSNLPTGVSALQYAAQPGAVSGIDVLTIYQLTRASFGMYTCSGVIHGHVVESSHFIRIMPETLPAVLAG